MSFSDTSPATSPPCAPDDDDEMRASSPPHKRKRQPTMLDVSVEIPESPWRSLESGGGGSGGDKLVGHFRSMKLAEAAAGVAVDDRDMVDAEESQPVVKRRLLHPMYTPSSPSPPPAAETGRKRLKSPPPEVTKDEDVETAVGEEADGEANGDKARMPEEEEEDDEPEDGIAYAPTPAQRYARSQKRMQQIKEYKLRESKEAREKRTAERRRRKSQSRLEAMSVAANAAAESRKKAVHFQV